MMPVKTNGEYVLIHEENGGLPWTVALQQGSNIVVHFARCGTKTKANHVRMALEIKDEMGFGDLSYLGRQGGRGERLGIASP